MFVGRKKEFKRLEKLYRSNQFQFVVMYGRRRVGKTRLVTEFIKGKRAIYFMAQETTEQENLREFSFCIQHSFSQDENLAYSTFQDGFRGILQYAKKEKIIIVIDEYPYLANTKKGFNSLMQFVIDHYFIQKNVMLIIMGSSISFMEEEVLAYKSPMYGRQTASMKIEPFSIFDVKEYFPTLTNEELAIVYAITGGIPLYLSYYDVSLSLEENVKEMFFQEGGRLLEEPQNLIKQEFREPSKYNAIIQGIALGYTKANEIATFANIEPNNFSSYVNRLINLGIIERKTPVGNPKGKKQIYSICDGLFLFWYRFIPGNMSLIQQGLSDVVWSRVQPHLSDYMGKVWEIISIQWLWEKAREGEFVDVFHQLGNWWGSDKISKKEVEIDILGIGENTYYFAECKWRKETTRMAILESVKEKSMLHNDKPYKKYILFSRSKFSESLLEIQSEDIILVTLDDFFS